MKIKYGDFTQITRGTTSNQYKSLENEIIAQTKKLLFDIDDLERGVRLLGITVSNFDNGKKNTKQLSLDF